jgi:hypothetical protein
MSENLDQLYEQAAFGRQIEEFLNTDIGKYLLHKAQIEAEDAMEKLVQCDAFNTEAVMKLQNKIIQAENFRQWLGQGINDGLSALQILEDNQHG